MLLALASASHAVAQDRRSPLVQGLLDNNSKQAERAQRPPAKYSTPDGRLSFVMDRTGERYALVRFDDSDEVYVLRAYPAAGGGEYWRTDTGDMLLRITNVGSVILYADPQRMGVPAAKAGEGEPVTLPPPPRGGLAARLESLKRDLAQRLGRPLDIEAPPNLEPSASALVADAAARAAEGLARSQRQAQTGTTIVRRVVIRTGTAPGAMVVNESLTVTVAPQLGYAGRPSADLITRTLSQRRTETRKSGE